MFWLNGGYIKNAIAKCKNHPSIIKIKKKIESTKNFSFDYLGMGCIDKMIQCFDNPKTSQKDDIPIKDIRDNRDLFSNVSF